MLRIRAPISRSHRPRFAAILLAISCCLAISGPLAPAARAKHDPPPPPGPASWQLLDKQQKVCASVTSTTAYYGAWIKGTWRHEIHVGLDGLPPGVTYT